MKDHELRVFDDSAGIEYRRLCSLKGALKLEMAGFIRSGRPVEEILREMGYTGCRKEILVQVEGALIHMRTQNGQ